MQQYEALRTQRDEQARHAHGMGISQVPPAAVARRANSTTAVHSGATNRSRWFPAARAARTPTDEEVNLKVMIGAAVGAAGMYFFDPQQGRRRRSQLQQRIGGAARRAAREAGRKAEYARGQVEGLRHTGSEVAPENDQTLVARVESEVLSRWKYPKGQISVNAIDGIVELRGTCDTPEQIDDLEAEVRKVTGVVDVRSFLHLPNTPAPNKQDVLDS